MSTGKCAEPDKENSVVDESAPQKKLNSDSVMAISLLYNSLPDAVTTSTRCSPPANPNFVEAMRVQDTGLS